MTDTTGPEGWRDQILVALRKQRPDSAWFFRKAGNCPEAMGTIDVFQKPDDVVANASGQALRIRLEWRHTPGQTEFFLPTVAGAVPPLDQIAIQLLAVADQMMARVELSSMPKGAMVRLGTTPDARMLGSTPLVLLAPPGALSLSFSLEDKVRRLDTLVVSGGFYEVNTDFRSARIDPMIRAEGSKTWPMWSLTVVSVLGSIWMAREQYLAQRGYNRLGASDASSDFSAKWDDLRTANILRNGFIGISLVFGSTAAWMEWSNAQKN